MRNLDRAVAGRKDFSCGKTINPMNNHEEIIVTGGRSNSFDTTRATHILDTVTRTWRNGRKGEYLFRFITKFKLLLSASIPVDVIGRSTVQVGDDFVLVGASDNGRSSNMLQWDSRTSRWIELEV